LGSLSQSRHIITGRVCADIDYFPFAGKLPRTLSLLCCSGIGLLVTFLVSTEQLGGDIKLVELSNFAMQTLRMLGVLNLKIYYSDNATIESLV
jgi:hypothetical protein